MSDIANKDHKMKMKNLKLSVLLKKKILLFRPDKCWLVSIREKF